MKKSMTLFLIAVITALPLIGLWPVQAQAAYSFSDGDGSPGDPYIIKTAEDLDHIRDDLTSNYTLYGDIDLSSYGSWQPIGSGPSDMFTGNFDGMGNTITGLTIHSSDNFIGLFGYVGGAATFKNVRLENVDITSSNANAQIGGLASLTVSYQNTIDRCSVTGNIEGVGFTAGGLLGQLSQGTLTNSDAHVHLELDSTNNSFAGGIVGAFQSGKMENNLATGDVSGKGYAGGLVGYQQSGDMINSYATGNVTGASTSTIGGLLGYWTNGDIKNSYSAGIVGPAGVAGGLVGKEDNTFGIGPIINSYWNLSDNPTLQTIGSEIEMDGAVTSDAMKHWATYTGWDPLVWGIQEGKTSPYLLSFSPALRVDPLPSSVVYSTEPGSNQFALSGYMRDGSIGEIFEVGYFIEDALNTTVAQDVYATDSTGDNQRFQFPVTLDESSYTAGTYTIHVTINDTVSGHASQQSLTFNVIDITAPAAPVFTSPVNGQTANDATPTFSGTAEPGSTVTIVLDGASAGTTTAAGDGSWTWTTAPTLAEGAHTASIRATDAAGNTGADSTITTFTVDVTAPAAPVITSPVNGQTANDATPTFSGTAEPGSTVTIVLDGASVGTTTAAGDGSWTWTTAPTLAEGAHTASIRATDAAGNTGTDSNVIAFTVDMTAPVITLLGDSAIALFEGDAFVDPGAAADDNFDRDLSDRITVTGTVYNQIPGTYTLRYNAQDIAGNAAAEVTRTVYVSARSSYSGWYLSGNADLKHLTVTAGGDDLALSPAFAAGTTSYKTETAAEQIAIQAVPSDANASVTLKSEALIGAKTVPLEDGDNRFEFSVKAENGTIKTYDLTVYRQEIPEITPCTYVDIEGHWAEAQICEAFAKGIVVGDSPTVFRPNGMVTRVEFAAMLLRSLGLASGSEADDLPFTDSGQIPSWAKGTISAAVEHGVLDGYPDGTLRPQQTINRSEMAAMLAKSTKWKPDSTQSSFADDADIPNWAKGYIQSAVWHGVLVGREGKRFVPDARATRAEAAVALLRLWKTASTNG